MGGIARPSAAKKKCNDGAHKAYEGGYLPASSLSISSVTLYSPFTRWFLLAAYAGCNDSGATDCDS